MINHDGPGIIIGGGVAWKLTKDQHFKEKKVGRKKRVQGLKVDYLSLFQYRQPIRNLYRKEK